MSQKPRPIPANFSLGPRNALPSFVSASRPSRAASASQYCLLGALSLALLGQLGWLSREQLAASARWRPLLSSACTLLHCRLPAWHEPSAFQLLEHEVRAAPEQAGVLLVRATFRNDARWPQAWPQLQLHLSDSTGRTVGSGVFTPRQYLGKATPDYPQLLPGQSAQIAFSVREPATYSAAYRFQFD